MRRAYHMAGRWSAQAGVTLIELMVVLAVIAALLVVGTMVLRDVSKEALREDATSMTAVLRAAHNMATMSRQHHRVVFDLEEQTYRIETCEGEIKLRKADREEAAQEIDPGEIPALEDMMRGTNLPPDVVQSIAGSDPARIAAAVSGKEVPEQCALASLANDDAQGRLNIRRVRTGDGVQIRRVHVQHLEEPVLEGTVSINFFPLGYAEKAVVEVTHEDGDQYTIVVFGLTGRVELEMGEIEADEHMYRDAAGDKVEERR